MTGLNKGLKPVLIRVLYQTHKGSITNNLWLWYGIFNKSAHFILESVAGFLECLHWLQCSVHMITNTIMTWLQNGCIKTYSRVSAAKKAVWHTSVLFTATANSPFSTPHISITTGPISIKFTYFMPSIYATQHTKFERNRPSSSQDMCSWKLPHFLHLFLLLRTVLQK